MFFAIAINMYELFCDLLLQFKTSFLDFSK